MATALVISLALVGLDALGLAEWRHLHQRQRLPGDFGAVAGGNRWPGACPLRKGGNPAASQRTALIASPHEVPAFSWHDEAGLAIILNQISRFHLSCIFNLL